MDYVYIERTYSVPLCLGYCVKHVNIMRGMCLFLMYEATKKVKMKTL